jgi:hypothetical protein
VLFKELAKVGIKYYKSAFPFGKFPYNLLKENRKNKVNLVK